MLVAKRAAVVHLLFNIIGATVWLAVYSIIRAIFMPAILDSAASLVGIAVVNTAFKVLSTMLLLPISSVLEKLAIRLIPYAKYEEKSTKLDDRLLVTPPLALGQARAVTLEMAEKAVLSLKGSMSMLTGYDKDKAEKIRHDEEVCDELEDTLGTYLIKLSAEQLGQNESEEATSLLKVIGDFERISDHAVNILESAEELRDKDLALSDVAKEEYKVFSSAVSEVLDSTLNAFRDDDTSIAETVEPLEQVIDDLKEQLRVNHILRMQKGKCTALVGFVWSDVLTNLERVSDHCSNIAGCIIDTADHNLNIHKSLHETHHGNKKFDELFSSYSEKYNI